MPPPDDDLAAQSPRARLSRRRLADEVRDLVTREFIVGGAVSAGQLLPSETQIAERYGVSRVTVRAGLRSLQDAGLVAIRQGIGTTVLPRRDAGTHALERLCSLETFARESGHTVESASLEVEEVGAGQQMARRFRVPLGHPILVVRAVKVVGGEKLAWTLDHLPGGMVTFESVRNEFAGSILDALLARGRPAIEYADTELVPLTLPADIARRLNVAAGTAALHVDASMYAAGGRVLGRTQSWILPRFRFSVRRQRPIGS